MATGAAVGAAHLYENGEHIAATFQDGNWILHDMPTAWNDTSVPGNRVQINCTGTLRGCRPGLETHPFATITGQNNAKGCVFVTADGGGSFGAGKRFCVHRELLVPLSRMTLGTLFASGGGGALRPSHAGKDLRSWIDGTFIPSYVQLESWRREDQLLLGQPGPSSRRAPVLPSLFLPGFPKSATTWLYTCLGNAFTPARMGCGADSSGWNASACPRRFLLSPVGASRWKGGVLLFDSLKETFFFGGNKMRRYRDNLGTLHGPDPLHGAPPGEPSLWPWESREQRARHWGIPAADVVVGRRKKRSGTHDLVVDRNNGVLMERLEALCSGSEPPCSSAGYVAGAQARTQRPARRARQTNQLTNQLTNPCHAPGECTATGAAVEGLEERPGESELVASQALSARLGLRRPLSDCIHAACHRTVRGVSSTFHQQCEWEDKLVGQRLKRNDSYCLMSLLPWASHAHEFEAVVADFTPNYLCDPDALLRLHRMSSRPEALRFLVLMREPTTRAFSEWSMFAMQWGWDGIGQFGPSFAMRVKQLHDCNATLFRNISLLRALPTTELADYLRQCWNYGGSMMYATNSLYAVCVLHALHLFPREQFLFLRYEDLMAMDVASLLKLIGRFSGLYAGDDLVAATRANGHCDPRGKKRAKSTYATLSPSEKVLYNLSKAHLATERRTYRDFFAPYNELLAELVGDTFRWAG